LKDTLLQVKEYEISKPLKRMFRQWQNQSSGSLRKFLLSALVVAMWHTLAKPGASAADDWSDRVSLTALAEARVGISTLNADLQLSELVLTPELNIEVSDRWRLTAIGRGRIDTSDKLEPGKPIQNNRAHLSRRAFIGDTTDLELREFYLDGEVGKVFLRLGKQQVVWGEADGLKVLDVVNPQSFREFILPRFDDSRIPLWIAKAEIPIGDASTLQLVWVPDRTYHDVPEPGSTFAFSSPQLTPQPTPGVPVTVLPPDRPSKFVADSDAGIRFATFVGGWELSLNYFYHYTDSPVFRRTIGSEGVTVSSKYERTHLIGGSFNNAFGDFVIRGEAGYSTNEFFLTNNMADVDGVTASGEFSYVVGIDWTGLSDTFLSVQFFQSVLTNSAPGTVRPDVENLITLFGRRNFRNETITAEALLIQNIADGDGVIQAELSYDWRDNIELYLGVDLFYGTSEGIFGEFNKNDRMVSGIRLGF